MCIIFKPRREREFLIVSTMIGMYCTKLHHTGASLCPDCLELLEYARNRLEKCKFGDHKPVCKDCPVHCYAPHLRDYMRKVMKWSGPKMISRHPGYTIIHLLDSWISKKYA